MEILEHIKEVIFADKNILGYLIAAIGSFGYLLLLIIKYTPGFIGKQIIKHFKKEKDNHIIASNYRKSIIPKIKKKLSRLAETTHVDRALLFEYSNGTANLVGLPFLYATATTEVVQSPVSQVSHLYQKMNVSLLADFIEDLEKSSYIYFKNIEEIKDLYPIIYRYMKPNGVKSAIFYSLYDSVDGIGFIVLTSVEEEFERACVLPRLAATAQLVSTLLNYDKIRKELEKN